MQPINQDKSKALEIWLATPGRAKDAPTPKSRDDFAENDVRLCLRRSPFPGLAESDLFTDFGIYAGRHGGKFIVVVIGLTIEGYIEYDSLEELKQEWEID